MRVEVVVDDAAKGRTVFGLDPDGRAWAEVGEVMLDHRRDVPRHPLGDLGVSTDDDPQSSPPFWYIRSNPIS